MYIIPNSLLPLNDELNHFGILGMKWGIRRYQNKDGSLTELGKKRLNYDRYVSGRTTDSTVKKGTKVSRFVQSPYADVFTYSFTQKANAPLTMYEVKKDLKVASAQQVIDHLVKDAGSVTIKSLIKNGGDIRNITMNYTWNRPYKETVNERFKKKGYDAIDDPNDPDSDMPIIVFNAKENLGQPYSTESGTKAIDRILKERAKKALNKK